MQIWLISKTAPIFKYIFSFHGKKNKEHAKDTHVFVRTVFSQILRVNEYKL